METHFARIARQTPLSEEQLAVIIGSLLGDGTLLSTTAGWCFRVHHGVRQKSYVDWKYGVLRNLVRTPPRVSGVEQLTPLALAVWIMDDGSSDGNALRINTQSFSGEENQRLIEILSDRYGLSVTLNKDKSAVRLRIGAADRDILGLLLEPYMLPSLRYKFAALNSG